MELPGGVHHNIKMSQSQPIKLAQRVKDQIMTNLFRKPGPVVGPLHRSVTRI